LPLGDDDPLGSGRAAIGRFGFKPDYSYSRIPRVSKCLPDWTRPLAKVSRFVNQDSDRVVALDPQRLAQVASDVTARHPLFPDDTLLSVAQDADVNALGAFFRLGLLSTCRDAD
jgi:hypothetical protein